MELGKLLERLEVLESTAAPETEITAVCYDSRSAVKGALFVAICGYETDGHKYAASAKEKGAAVLLCQYVPEGLDMPYVRVKDTRRALALVSAAFYGYPAEKLNIVGVTGTNGKTTSTTLIKEVIERCTGDKVGLIGTNRNMIGDEELPTERTTPESADLQELFARMVEKGCKWAVMEVSSHSLYLGRVEGIRFHTGVFTNLTQDHLDFHKTMQAYAEAKAILFANCDRAVINIDDEYGPFMAESAKCPVLSVSVGKNEAGLVAKNVKLAADRVEFLAVTMGEVERITLGIPGAFSVYNALSALGFALGAGIKLSAAAAALACCSGVKGRAEVVPAGEGYTVLIDYAHTPDALENILNTAKGFAQGRVVALFGCGGDRDRTKRPKMGAIAAELADYVIVTSDNPRTEQPGEIIKDILEGMKDTKTPYTVIENRREAIWYALENAQPGDVIILAGKGHETYQIIGKEKHHMDEREIVADYFKR